MKYDSVKFPKETSYVGTYNDIISAIASGANKVNEIADMAHVEQSVCSSSAISLSRMVWAQSSWIVARFFIRML